MKESRFFAYLDRLRLIKRWSLKRSVVEEDVSQHSWSCATIAHTLTIIRFKILNNPSDEFTPELVATTALYHDISEILTDDLASPIKNHTEKMKNAFKEIESIAELEMLSLLPHELKGHFKPFILHDHVHPEVARLVKAADIISAYTKCLTELNAGNNEFTKSAINIKASLDRLDMPEVEYFMENFIKAFSLTVDDLLE